MREATCSTTPRCRSCAVRAGRAGRRRRSTRSPSLTSRLALAGISYSSTSVITFVTRTMRRSFSCMISTTPSISLMIASPLGARASKSSSTRGRPLVMSAAARDTTGVERAHRELGPRLADRLGGDDADRRAELHEIAPGKVAAVAEGADARARLRTTSACGRRPASRGSVNAVPSAPSRRSERAFSSISSSRSQITSPVVFVDDGHGGVAADDPVPHRLDGVLALPRVRSRGRPWSRSRLRE